MCCLTLPIFPFAAYLVEKLAYRKYKPEPVVVILHIVITTATVLYPVHVILSCDSAFLSGLVLMLFACIVWLKLVSYAHTNYDMRAIINSIEKPVHKWMLDHIYFPCLQHNIPKGVAILIAFFISAVFHELCIAVPCHMFKLWAFIGIMFQIPLVVITNYLQQKLKSSTVGNMIFWFIFLHSWSTDVLSSILLRLDEQKREG